MYGHVYTEDEIDFLLKKRPFVTKDKLAEMFNSKFNTNISAKALQQICVRRGIYSLDDGCFKKGHISHNKGKKQSEYMTDEQIDKSKATRFKKGNVPPNHRNIGDERVLKDGYTEIKIAEPNKWILKHRYIWEQQFGALKKNETVEFIDGNKSNLSLDNLIKVTRKQSAVMTKLNIRKHGSREALECAKTIADIVLKIGEKK